MFHEGFISISHNRVSVDYFLNKPESCHLQLPAVSINVNESNDKAGVKYHKVHFSKYKK